MLKIADFNNLKVAREVDFGVYLDAGDEGEILMPSRYVPEGCKVGDEVCVFVYTDSEDRLVATTEKPYVVAGEVGVLKVKQITDFGAFLDWGVFKDILLPYSEQTADILEGDNVVVYVYVDNKSKRPVCTMKWDRHVDYTPDESLAPGTQCTAVIAGRTPLGYKALVNRKYYGLLYANEVFSTPKLGDEVTAYIKKVREDGKLDISLRPIGFVNKIGGDCEKIMQLLRANGGFMPTTDKAPAETIYATYGISKKAYKQAVGSLYKQKLIDILPNGIKLNE